MQTNKATTNIFGVHTQPRKTTRYTNKLKLAWGGGGGGGGEGKRACFAPILAKFSAPQANFWKNSKKKAVFGHFLKNFDKKNCVFFGARSPQS